MIADVDNADVTRNTDGIAVSLARKLRHCKNVSTTDDVELQSYIATWENMKQILDAMGSIFTFTSSEINSKGIMLF